MYKLIIILLLTQLLNSDTEFRATPYNIGDTKLKPYQLVNSNIEKYKKMSMLKYKDGIPLLKFKDKNIYYPITISQIALHYYAHYYETNDKNSKKEFLKYAKWMKDNFQDNGTWGGGTPMIHLKVQHIILKING